MFRSADHTPANFSKVLGLLVALLFMLALFVVLPSSNRPILSRWPGPQDAGMSVAQVMSARQMTGMSESGARAEPQVAGTPVPASRPIVEVTTPIVQGNQGLQYGAIIDDDGHILLHDEALRLMAQAGAGWIKINFRLGGFANWTETTTFGYSALSLYDQIVANARSRNLKVLGELSNEAWPGIASQWQENNVETAGRNGNNQYIQDFAQNAAVVLTQHYAGQVDVWEVWNEPSQPNTYMYPSNFAQLLAQVYTKTKTAGVARARFVSGGITSVQDSNGNITSASSGADYLREVYAQGKQVAGWEKVKTQYGSYPLDRVGQHIYFDNFAFITATNIGMALQLLRDAYVESEGGTTAKQTVITEFGWATNNMSEEIHATNLQMAYTTFKKIAYVRQAYWFFLQDEPAPGLYFGLLRADLSQKPAWNAYQTYAIY